VFGKFNVGPALRDQGVNPETIAVGANADAMLPFADFTGSQRRTIDGIVDNVYNGFLLNARALPYPNSTRPVPSLAAWLRPDARRRAASGRWRPGAGRRWRRCGAWRAGACGRARTRSRTAWWTRWAACRTRCASPSRRPACRWRRAPVARLTSCGPAAAPARRRAAARQCHSTRLPAHVQQRARA